MSNKPIHQLTRDMDHYLGVLSKLYQKDGATQKLDIIVNAQVRTEDGWTYDNWNGGTYGHALFLSIPESLYLGAARSRDQLQIEIARDINQLHNVPDESVAECFIEMQKTENGNWRQESGVLRGDRRVVPARVSQRIWGDGYRVFLSHKVKSKKKTSEVKEALKPFGITSFVAHEDIHPTQAWQDEIESALFTMDAFVALMTPDFHDSDWTDQEVGFALGRNVPIIAVRLGRDPYGFIGKFQDLPADWEDAPVEIAKLLMQHTEMVDAFIATLPGCKSFAQGNTLSTLLPHIGTLSEAQGDSLVAAFNGNYELQNSFGFNGLHSYGYGDGLPRLLQRTLNRDVVLNESKQLVPAAKKRRK